MDIQEFLEKVNQRVYKQFPYMEGNEPEIIKISDERISFTYRGNQITANGHQIPLTVKVTVNEFGEIEKLATSKEGEWGQCIKNSHPPGLIRILHL